MGQPAGLLREPRAGERFVYPQPEPELVPEMDRPGLPGLLDRDSARADPHRLIVGRGWNGTFTRNRRRPKRRTATEQAPECGGRVGERELAGLGGLDLAH